ncbi:MAG: GTP-binding protein [Flavobacteriales bacterium]|nr:GTP-binding protein [Flavobacteriales bacterium]
MKLQDAIDHRKTFAIISHPDAGKTTLTEKFLLYGGAIQTAGAVKSNKIKKTATSDFMEIERQRGISVATSVMGFRYQDMQVNILDTPGHKDFAEDTYRTLTAVDSVILVIDCVKGVEEQTEKLMEVCRMRNTPVMIFVNKMDRDGKDAFDLLDELEEKLKINTTPLSWPIGIGPTFKGVYNIYDKGLRLFEASKTKLEATIAQIEDLADPDIEKYIGEEAASTLREDVEMATTVYGAFEREKYLKAELAPVFFGSALNNFGFKIHANLDPRHRDRIAFLRVCSGKFERNTFFHHVRLDKNLKFPNPSSFMASEKSTIEEAFPGDVIGLYDTGNFKIGDTLTEGEKLQFKGIPSFSPEIFKEVENRDPMKTKQLEKGIRQLTDEGVAQLFVQEMGNKKIIGTVGELQFDVIQYRLEHEYGAKCEFRPMRYYKACWITSDNQEKLDEFIRIKTSDIVKDKDDNWVFLAPSAWILKLEQQNYPDLKFHTTSEFKTEALA